jgi:hypothetical protein
MNKTIVIGPGWLRPWRPPRPPRPLPSQPPQQQTRPDEAQRRRVADALRQGRVARREALKAALRRLWAS